MTDNYLHDVWPGEADNPFERAWEGATGDDSIRVHENYRHDLIGWARDVLGIPEHTLRWSMNEAYASHRWDGTADPFVAMAKAIEEWHDVAAESGTGTGKSFFCAIVILWFLACWEDSRAFTFAPKEDQLRLYIWMEIGKVWSKFQAIFPTAQLTDLCIRMRGGTDDSWGARGYAVGVRAGEQVATKAAGMHAAHMLIIGEETPGIPTPVIAAHENTCTAPHNIRIYVGNPDHQQDALHVLTQTPGVVAVRISGLDHPNVVCGDADIIAGAVSVKSIKRREKKYGLDSRLYNSRVRGISPLEAEDALIKGAWVRAAQQRWLEGKLRAGARALGVDVANSEDGDDAAIAEGEGAFLLEVRTKKCPDANKLGAEVVALARANRISPKHVGIDGVGVGAGTVNEAKRLKFFAVALLGGEQRSRLIPTFDADAELEDGKRGVVNVEKFISLRAQMYWQMREDLRSGRVALPDDDELMMDLLAPTWSTYNGIIRVESKEDIRERLGRSTNKGDAAVYWNWVRPRENERRGDDDDLDAFSPEALVAEVEEKKRLGGRLAKRRRRDHYVDDGGY